MNEDFSNVNPNPAEMQPAGSVNLNNNNNNYRMNKIMEDNQNVDAIVNAITFLGNTYQLGKGLIGKKFNIFDFKTDIALVQEAKAAFDFVGTLPQIEGELVDAITPDEEKQISDAVVALGILKQGTNQVDAVKDGIDLANQIKNYLQKYF